MKVLCIDFSLLRYVSYSTLYLSMTLLDHVQYQNYGYQYDLCPFITYEYDHDFLIDFVDELFVKLKFQQLRQNISLNY